MTLREDLANLAHDQWSHWMKHLFYVSEENEDGSVTIPKELVERWKRQINTRYIDLSDIEQNSDREQADKYLKAFESGKTFEAELHYGNGRTHRIQANTIEVLKSKCSVHIPREEVPVIEVNSVQTIGYFKLPIEADGELL